MGEVIKFILKYPFILFVKILLYLYYEFTDKVFYYRNENIKGGSKRVLFISPREYDEVIAISSTLLKHNDRGDLVKGIYMDSYSEGFTEDRLERISTIKDLLKIDDIDIVKNENIRNIGEIIDNYNPDIIYMPMLLDGDEECFSLMKKIILNMKDNMAEIYLYDIEIPIKADMISHVVTLNKKDYKKKVDVFNELKDLYRVDFEVFKIIMREKRFITGEFYAIETFLKTDIEKLNKNLDYLEEIGYNPEDFIRIRNLYNVVLSYRKNKLLKYDIYDGMKHL